MVERQYCMNRVTILHYFLTVTILAQGMLPLATYAEPSAWRPSTVNFGEIDSYVLGEMRRAASPGLAYAIVHNDKIVHMNAFGIADPYGHEMTTTTPFIIGSVGKTFTALAIRQLVNAGRVDPNVPAQMYIPWFRVADLQASAQITVQNLLDHKSGIPRSAGEQRYQLNGRYTLEDLVRRAATVQLNSKPGTTFEYSNVNFLVLGLIIEKVSGQSYAEYIQQHILFPLEMRHTYFDEQEAQENGLATGYQSWYGFFVPVHAEFPLGMQPAGYSISTVQDMGNYLIAYLNNGKYGETSVLYSGMNETPGASSQVYNDIYWNERPFDPNIMEGQSGGTLNFNADIQIVPADKWGVVVLMNSRWTLDGIVPTITAASIADGIARRVKGWQQLPSAPLSFHQWYLLIDAILLALVLLGIFQIVRARKRVRAHHFSSTNKLSGLVFAAIADFVVASCLLAIPISQELALDYFLTAIPDVAIIICSVAIMLFVAAFLNVTILAVGQRKDRSRRT